MTPERRDWFDIGYAVEATPRGHYVEVRVCRLVASAEALFPLEGGSGSGDITEEFALAETFLSGFVNRGGCADLKFRDNEYLHFCGPGGAAELGTLMHRLYALALELLRGVDGLYIDFDVAPPAAPDEALLRRALAAEAELALLRNVFGDMVQDEGALRLAYERGVREERQRQHEGRKHDA